MIFVWFIHIVRFHFDTVFVDKRSNKTFYDYNSKYTRPAFDYIACNTRRGNKNNLNKTPRKIQNGKYLIKWQNQTIKHIKRIENNCHIPDLVQAYSYEENGGLNLVYSARPLTFMTVESNSIILTTMREQKR